MKAKEEEKSLTDFNVEMNNRNTKKVGQIFDDVINQRPNY